MNWMTSAKKRVYRKKRGGVGAASSVHKRGEGLHHQARQKYEANQKDAMTLLQTLQYGKSHVNRSRLAETVMHNNPEWRKDEEREMKRHIPPDRKLLRSSS